MIKSKRQNAFIITLVGNSNDPPQKYCILDVIKRLINQSRLVKTGRNWLKLVETGQNWSKLSKLVETCNGLPCSKTNRTFIWTFLNLIFLLSDTWNHGWHSMFYESLIILNISTLNFSEGVPASVLANYVLLVNKIHLGYEESAPNISNETSTFMCLGRAGRFGQC